MLRRNRKGQLMSGIRRQKLRVPPKELLKLAVAAMAAEGSVGPAYVRSAILGHPVALKDCDGSQHQTAYALLRRVSRTLGIPLHGHGLAACRQACMELRPRWWLELCAQHGITPPPAP